MVLYRKSAVGIDLCPRVNTFFVSRNWHNHCFGTQIWQTRRYLETVLRFTFSTVANLVSGSLFIFRGRTGN